MRRSCSFVILMMRSRDEKGRWMNGASSRSASSTPARLMTLNLLTPGSWVRQPWMSQWMNESMDQAVSRGTIGTDRLAGDSGYSLWHVWAHDAVCSWLGMRRTVVRINLHLRLTTTSENNFLHVMMIKSLDTVFTFVGNLLIASSMLPTPLHPWHPNHRSNLRGRYSQWEPFGVNEGVITWPLETSAPPGMTVNPGMDCRGYRQWIGWSWRSQRWEVLLNCNSLNIRRRKTIGLHSISCEQPILPHIPNFRVRNLQLTCRFILCRELQSDH